MLNFSQYVIWLRVYEDDSTGQNFPWKGLTKTKKKKKKKKILQNSIS